MSASVYGQRFERIHILFFLWLSSANRRSCIVLVSIMTPAPNLCFASLTMLSMKTTMMIVHPCRTPPCCDLLKNLLTSTSYTANNCMHLSTRSLERGQERGWLLVGVVAQWQSTGGLSQRPWVRFPVALLSLEPFQRSSGQ